MLSSVVLASFVSCVLSAALPEGLVPLLDGRIVGGQSTTIEEFPHQVSMRYFGAHRCGGSIVSKDIIISASHCVDGLVTGLIGIRAGTTNNQGEGVNRKVSEVFMHEQYNRNSFDNDISVLVLSQPLQFSPSIQPVRLPTPDDVVQSGKPAFVSGWGALMEHGQSANILQFVEVSVVDQGKCAQDYRQTGIITSSMLCAGYNEGGKDSCQGDSGGPLITFDDKHDATLIGVVSWGYGCARPKHPGVYAKVPALRHWIDNKFRIAKHLAK